MGELTAEGDGFMAKREKGLQIRHKHAFGGDIQVFISMYCKWFSVFAKQNSIYWH